MFFSRYVFGGSSHTFSSGGIRLDVWGIFGRFYERVITLSNDQLGGFAHLLAKRTSEASLKFHIKQCEKKRATRLIGWVEKLRVNFFLAHFVGPKLPVTEVG